MVLRIFTVRNITEMSDSLRSLSENLPRDCEIMACSVLDSLFQEQVFFVFRHKGEKPLTKAEKILRFEDQFIDGGSHVFIGYEFHEFLDQLDSGNTEGLSLLFLVDEIRNLKESRFSFGEKSTSLFQEWNYFSSEWEKIFNRPSKQFLLVSKKTFKETTRKADNLLSDWKKFMDRFTAEGHTKKNTITAGNATEYTSEMFFSKHLSAALAIAEMAETLLMMAYHYKYPRGTKVSLKMFETTNASTRSDFHEKILQVRSGDMSPVRIEKLAEKLKKSLGEMGSLFPASPNRDAVKEILEEL